ncbi:MAG: hypothetical protein KTR25_02150 [Myxococcales bacterium]|nr:hypothetical protein [Myxococcales bacterium]
MMYLRIPVNDRGLGRPLPQNGSQDNALPAAIVCFGVKPSGKSINNRVTKMSCYGGTASLIVLISVVGLPWLWGNR